MLFCSPDSLFSFIHVSTYSVISYLHLCFSSFHFLVCVNTILCISLYTCLEVFWVHFIWGGGAPSCSISLKSLFKVAASVHTSINGAFPHPHQHGVLFKSSVFAKLKDKLPWPTTFLLFSKELLSNYLYSNYKAI